MKLFSTSTNCENVAKKSFRSKKCSARGVNKITIGMTGQGCLHLRHMARRQGSWRKPRPLNRAGKRQGKLASACLRQAAMLFLTASGRKGACNGWLTDLESGCAGRMGALCCCCPPEGGYDDSEAPLAHPPTRAHIPRL